MKYQMRNTTSEGTLLMTQAAPIRRHFTDDTGCTNQKALYRWYRLHQSEGTLLMIHSLAAIPAVLNIHSEDTQHRGIVYSLLNEVEAGAQFTTPMCKVSIHKSQPNQLNQLACSQSTPPHTHNRGESAAELSKYRQCALTALSPLLHGRGGGCSMSTLVYISIKCTKTKWVTAGRATQDWNCCEYKWPQLQTGTQPLLKP